MRILFLAILMAFSQIRAEPEFDLSLIKGSSEFQTLLANQTACWDFRLKMQHLANRGDVILGLEHAETWFRSEYPFLGGIERLTLQQKARVRAALNNADSIESRVAKHMFYIEEMKILIERLRQIRFRTMGDYHAGFKRLMVLNHLTGRTLNKLVDRYVHSGSCLDKPLGSPQK